MIRHEKKVVFVVIGCVCLGYAALNANNSFTSEKEMHGIVTHIFVEDLTFKDENQVEYIISMNDFDFTKKQLREEDTIIVSFKGEILEVFPARFAQVIDIQRERD